MGAGFSGLLLALHLLRLSQHACVFLIERAPSFGRGLAYGAADADHLLNVRASNMSAFVDEPNHFVEWLGRTAARGGYAFASRQAFGTYLQQLLREAVGGEAAAGRLMIVPDEVTGLRQGGRIVQLAVGRELAVDVTVLATGNLPPLAPPHLPKDLVASARYIADPWAEDAFAKVGRDEDVLVIGTGLTAIDIVARLKRRGHRGRIIALSRRGLRPRAHASGAPPRPVDLAIGGRPQLSRLLHHVRRRATEVEWRDAVDALRPVLQGLWRNASHDQRERFLRHLRPYWDVHRHRLAPNMAAEVEGWIADGSVRFMAARLVGGRADSERVALKVQPRGHADSELLSAHHIVNCTGPTGTVSMTNAPFLASLVDGGLARADACGLGLDVDAECRILGRNGRANDRLFAIGPLSRGAFWEIIAVPDIRVQALELATRLATNANGRSAERSPSGSATVAV